MRPLRVLAVIKGLDRGGAEMLLTDAASRFDRREVQLTVVRVLRQADTLTPPLARSGTAVLSLGARSGQDPAWPRRLKALLDEGHFDVAHTHSPLPGAVTRVVAPRRLPLVHTEHSSWDNAHPLTRALNQATYPRLQRVLAVSHAVARSITRPPVVVPPSAWPPIEVLHHGIDLRGRPQRPDTTPEARSRLWLGEDDEVIGSVANFDPEKDHATLIDAFAALLRTRPRARLVLVGGGVREPDVRTMVAARGLAERVTLLGTRSDVPDLLPAFDVLALSSRQEGFPVTLLEAMAAGVPIVATDVGGVGEATLEEQAALLVPAGDPRALGAAIDRSLDDTPATARRVAAGLARVRELDPERTVERYTTLYHEAVETRR